MRELETPGISSALHDLSERWFQAWLGKDAATVERLVADDYIYVAPNGATLDRQAILAIIRSPSYRLDHGRRTEVVVRALGHEAAVVRHRYQGAGSFGGSSGDTLLNSDDKMQASKVSSEYDPRIAFNKIIQESQSSIYFYST